jgi:hypothetical protein
MFDQASKPVRIAAGLIGANWLAWTFYCVAIGGEALNGDIIGGQYFIRRNPSSTSIPVSPEFWLFSLVYTSLTVGGSVLALVLLIVFHRPRWDRGLLDKILIAFATLWLLIISLQAGPRFIAWAAA